MPEPGADVRGAAGGARALSRTWSRVARTAFAPALLLSPRAPEGVDALVKALELPDGLDDHASPGRACPTSRGRSRDLEAKGATPVLLGAGLAKRLGARAGEHDRPRDLVRGARGAASPSPARTPLTVAAVVETGFSEVDDGWAVVPLAVFERLAPPGARQGVWEMKLARPSASDETVAAARKLLGDERDGPRLEGPEPRPLRGARHPADAALHRPDAHRGRGGGHGRVVARRPPRREDAGRGRPRRARRLARARGPHVPAVRAPPRRDRPRPRRSLRRSSSVSS